VFPLVCKFKINFFPSITSSSNLVSFMNISHPSFCISHFHFCSTFLFFTQIFNKVKGGETQVNKCFTKIDMECVVVIDDEKN